MDHDEGETVDDYTRAIASILKTRQQETGPSYTQLAATTGLGRATIERALNGKREIKSSYLRLLCEALELDITAVLTEADKRA